MAALTIGFFGSLHCLGMCGPLYLTFMGRTKGFLPFVTYHIGRLLAYLLIGGFLALIGSSIRLFNIQQIMTIFFGVFLLMVYAIPTIRVKIEKYYYQSLLSRKLKAVFAMKIKGPGRWMISGFANGFLPCGLTYVAAVGAMMGESLWEGVSFMILFGVGTIPAMAAIAFLPNLPFKKLQSYIPKAVPVIAFISGLILVLRGVIMTSPDIDHMVRMHASALITVCGL